MKPIHIVALAVIAIGIAALTLQAKDVARYNNFGDAQKSGDKVKVAGQLAKDKPMVYDPFKDPNKFSFYLRDDKGQEVLVHLMKPKPQDFELSEQVVVTGEMQNNVFVANDVLTKCPSKYKDEEIYMKKNKS
jgi:cytochrome c-type biogenesis protein CcmE